MTQKLHVIAREGAFPDRGNLLLEAGKCLNSVGFDKLNHRRQAKPPGGRLNHQVGMFFNLTGLLFIWLKIATPFGLAMTQKLHIIAREGAFPDHGNLLLLAGKCLNSVGFDKLNHRRMGSTNGWQAQLAGIVPSPGGVKTKMFVTVSS
jgi:hypothetical protein